MPIVQDKQYCRGRDFISWPFAHITILWISLIFSMSFHYLGRYKWGYSVVSSGSAWKLPIKNGYKIFIVYRHFVEVQFFFFWSVSVHLCNKCAIWKNVQDDIKKKHFRITVQFNLVFHRYIYMYIYFSYLLNIKVIKISNNGMWCLKSSTV
jgi:hypothetical protein